MFIYWAIFLVLAAGALFNREDSIGRYRLAFLVFAALPTLLMVGLRWKIGPDWLNYLDQFKYTGLFSLDRILSHVDPGYFVINWFVHQIHGPFWYVNVVCGTIFVSGLTAFSMRQPNPWLAFLVAFPYLVIVVAMSGNRQSAALGFLFFALNAFERAQLVRFIAFTVLAALFHGSVSLVIPLCLLAYTSNNLQRTVLLLITAALGLYFLKDAFSVYARRYSGEEIQSSGVIYRLAMNALAAVTFLFFGRRFNLDDRQRKIWWNFSACTLFFILLLAVVPSSTAIDRFLLYLFPLQFFVLSRLPTVFSQDTRQAGQFTLLVILYAAAVQVTFLQFGTYSSYYIPYRSVLQQ